MVNVVYGRILKVVILEEWSIYRTKGGVVSS